LRNFTWSIFSIILVGGLSFWKIFLRTSSTDHMMHNANWWAFFKSGEEIKIGRLVGIFKQIIPSYPWISLRYIIVLYFDKKKFLESRGKNCNCIYGTSKANTQKWSKNTYGLWEMIFFQMFKKVLLRCFFKEIGIYTCYRVHTQK